jgi:hypothetical protein
MLVYVNDRSMKHKPTRVRKGHEVGQVKMVTQEKAKGYISRHPEQFKGLSENEAINFAFELLLEATV